MILEKKVFEIKIDDVDSQGMIRGFASTFGNEDLGGDIVDSGAFKKSIKESRGMWPILADHNPSEHIGWNQRAEETDRGLLVEGQLDLNVQKAREKYSLAKKAADIGAKMGLSIGFTTIKAEPDRANPRIRRIKEVKLWEYSIVTFPMNPEAFITAAKSSLTSGPSVDKVRELLNHLKQMGCTDADLYHALRYEEPQNDSDPQIMQSLEGLIALLK